MRYAVILFLVLPLAGCLTQQERIDQAQQMSREAIARNEAQDDQQCRSYGAKPGSDVYVNCRAQLMDGRNAASPAPTTCVRSGNVTNCS